MASSPIQINEATVEELLSIRGIGPRRAEYIIAFRQEVGPIRNAFDLATATGISIKAAEQMVGQVSWGDAASNDQVHFWPLALTCTASLWLLTHSFTQLSLNSPLLAEQILNVALILILLGSVLAAMDITAAALLHFSSETTRFFPVSIATLGLGLTLLILIGLTSLILTLPGTLEARLHEALLFVVMTILMIWLMYGPSISLRALVTSGMTLGARTGGTTGQSIEKARLVYDLSIIPIAIICTLTLIFFEQTSWLNEIFSLWVLVIMALNSSELLKGRPAFTAMLSDLDRSRFHFLLRHQTGTTTQLGTNRSMGLGVSVFGFLLLGALVATQLNAA